jgi:hypothetical protein
VAGISIVHAIDNIETESYAAPDHVVVGTSRSRIVSPQPYSLWLVTAELAAGSQLQFPAQHGDEAIYVTNGSLDVDGRLCPAQGTVVIESKAHPLLRSLEPTTIVHVGPYDPTVPAGGLNGPVDHEGDHVHVVGPGGTYAAIEPGRDTHYFADSTCETCRLTLLYTSRSVPYISSTHSHSVDELIHVMWGELRLGNQVVNPGDTVAVAADRRYGFRSGPEGFGFLNYRSDASQQVVARGSEPRLEGGLANGMIPVMDLR